MRQVYGTAATGSKRMRRTAILVLALLISPQPAWAQDAVADFYRGRTVTLIVGYSAGGGYDTYSRILARHGDIAHAGEHVVGLGLGDGGCRADLRQFVDMRSAGWLDHFRCPAAGSAQVSHVADRRPVFIRRGSLPLTHAAAWLAWRCGGHHLGARRCA